MDSSYVVSVQQGENLVTNPAGGEMGEEWVATLQGDGFSVVSRQGAVREEPILSEIEITELLRAGEKIHTSFAKLFGASPELPNLRFDVEFKFVLEEASQRKRKLIIKQARPLGG
jgi:hypothetical protein